MSVTGSMPSSCCTLPPVQVDYTPTGDYTSINDLKTYVVGDKESKQAVLIVYDVFGFSPQILQGADLLASQGFTVYMPDFLKGNYAQGSWFSGTEEGTKARTEWFSQFPGAVSSQAAIVGKMIKEIKTKHGKVGAAGFCWGYKVLVLTENSGELAGFAGCHPSMAAADDIEHISVPLALLPSQGEDIEMMKTIYEGVEKKAPGKNFIKHYSDMPHGWMAARGDLKNDPGAKEYHDGWSTLSAFFKENM